MRSEQYRIDAFNEVFATTIEEGKLVGINGQGTFNTGNIMFDNDMIGYCTIVSASGSEESAIDPNEARLFNAVGQVIEMMMLDNAVSAARGTKAHPSHTRYDETINALIGNTKSHWHRHLPRTIPLQLPSQPTAKSIQGHECAGRTNHWRTTSRYRGLLWRSNETHAVLDAQLQGLP